LTFNILGLSRDLPQSTGERHKRIIQSVENNNIDVAMLQEIRILYDENGEIKYSTENWIQQSQMGVNSRVKMAYCRRRGSSREGVGIMSGYEILEAQDGWLPKGMFSRKYLLLKVEIQGHLLHFLTFHLAAPAIGRIASVYGATEERQTKARQQQFDKIVEVVNKLSPDYPLIVGGDFNATSEDESYLRWRHQLNLTEIFPDTPRQSRKTFATHRSPSFDYGLELRFDHLLYREGKKVQIRTIEEGIMFDKPVVDSSQLYYGFLSDHAGVYADFSFVE